MSSIGTLYIVATPIGNMEDITLRAIEVLKKVDLVVCEDTRVSGALMHKLEIKKPLQALHQHSADIDIDNLAEKLLRGQNIAYVTDGGTPGISDPGQRLVQKVRQQKNQVAEDQKNIIEIIPIPGPSALTAAVSVSGIVEKEFYFTGFLPKKKGRQTELKKLAEYDVPIVIYESALRLEKTLQELKEYLGEQAEVFIAREMTKMFEEYWGGDISDVLRNLANHKLKGEMVLIVKSQKSKVQNQARREHRSKY